MEKYIYLFAILFFVVLIPVALYLIFKPMFQQRKILNGVVNYDIFMKKFVFQIDFTKEEFYSKLKIHNVYDVLEYDFDEQSSVVTFKRYNARFPYKIEIDEFKESIVLRVEQIPLVMDKGNVPYYINEFFIKKFDAKPIDYQNFGLLECTPKIERCVTLMNITYAVTAGNSKVSCCFFVLRIMKQN